MSFPPPYRTYVAPPLNRLALSDGSLQPMVDRVQLGNAPAPAKPGPPTFSLSAAAGQVTIAWQNGPANGAAINSQNLYRATQSGGPYTKVKNITTPSPYVDGGLEDGTRYYYQLASVNQVGEGDRAAEQSIVCGGAPSRPGSPVLQVQAGNGSGALSWTVPAANGSAITDYVVEYELTTDAAYTTYNDGVGTGTTATIPGLTNGKSYNARVSAVNGVGRGDPSNVVTFTPSSAPGAPQ